MIRFVDDDQYILKEMEFIKKALGQIAEIPTNTITCQYHTAPLTMHPISSGSSWTRLK